MSDNKKFDITDLETIIAARAGESADKSYTAKLLAKGLSKCAEKFGEEAVEAIVAAAKNDRSELVKETGDVLFHLLVMLKAADISLQEVMAELENRTNQSGLQEKASRQ